MSSSFGRLALGIGFALIAPAGFAAVGFSIGSALGGFLFAPDGPDVEGPRLGDLDVTASTLGKIIPEHYGVTRSSGNVFWSGGLKEVKTEEESGGGKGGGGGGGTQTTYEYFASFAVAFGKGRAEELLRLWGDGKIIYDAGVRNIGDTQNSFEVISSSKRKSKKYNYRFRKGAANVDTETTNPDSLIEESINRRLAGAPDVNQGDGEQATYTTMNDLIAQYSAETDARSQLYAQYLTELNDESLGVAVQAIDMVPGTVYTIEIVGTVDWTLYGAPTSTVGQVFTATGAPLAGIGQVRLGTQNPPDYQFTPGYKEIAYVVFIDMPLEDFGNRIPNITAEIAWRTDNTISLEDTVNESAVGEISAVTTTPSEAMAVDVASRSALVLSAGTQLRRFSLSNASETIDINTTYTPNITMQTILCADASGDWIVRGTTEVNGAKLYKLDNSSLTLKSSDESQMNPAFRTATFGTNAGTNGGRSLVAVCNPNGDFSVANSNTSRIYDAAVYAGVGLGDGPMIYGGGTPGNSIVYWASNDGTNFNLFRVDLTFSGTFDPVGSDQLAGGQAIEQVTTTFTSLGTYGLAGGYVSAVLYNQATGRVFVLLGNNGGGASLYEFDPLAEGSGVDPYLQDVTNNLTGTPPVAVSGLSRSGISGGILVYANGTNAYSIDITDGSETVYTNVLSGSAASTVQMFEPSSSALFTWVGGVPSVVIFNRLSGSLFANDISSIVEDICKRVGYQEDEYDVDGIAGLANVRGYTIARPVNGRKALESMFRAYFVEGVESDWTLKFKPQDTNPVRIIEEDELGRTQSPTGDVTFLAKRSPEQEIPAEVSLAFSDPNRDYQQGAAHYRRVSQPTPSMYSRKVENIELPFVLNDREARSIAERILFLAWMSRDQGAMKYPWTHIDLDPGDVVQFKFNDGRVLTDRLVQVQIGANFEIEGQSVRSGDPVFVPSTDTPVGSTTIPVNTILTPAFAKLFVLDIPLLYDFHDLNRTATRYYTAVGSDTTTFSSADLFASTDGLGFVNFDSVNVDVTWGTITSGALGAPRSLHSIDRENTFTVTLSVDNGDLSSITLDQLIGGIANRALIYNSGTGVAELIQFQNVTANPDGTYTFDTLVRGRRGTDYAVASHGEGETFILVADNSVIPQTNELSVIGNTRYYKAVSRGALVSDSPSVGEVFDGNDLKPYAPNYVRRTDDTVDLTVSWNRRTRLGGVWNMNGEGIEEVPLNEDFEQYRCYLLPNTPTALEDFTPGNADSWELLRQVSIQEAVFTGTELATAGYTLNDTINVAVYQISAQVGQGFGRVVGLAP